MKHPLGRKDISRALRESPRGVTPPPAEAFWDDFKARARHHPQHAPASAPQPFYGWAVAAASAILLVGVGVGSLHFRSVPHADGSAINSFEVNVAHSAVLILGDTPTEGTILWGVDMDTESSAGEST